MAIYSFSPAFLTGGLGGSFCTWAASILISLTHIVNDYRLRLIDNMAKNGGFPGAQKV
ncbi:MAG: hypothetical protein K6L73_11435 [Cellvibrionaceae bacterium]